MSEPDLGPRSNRQGQLLERNRQPPARWLVNRQFVMAPSNVLYEGMTSDDYSGVPVLLESTHRSQPCLQPAVICLDAVVLILLAAMPRAAAPPARPGRPAPCRL